MKLKTPYAPATLKQLNFLKELDIEVNRFLTKQEASDMIGNALDEKRMYSYASHSYSMSANDNTEFYENDYDDWGEW